MTALTKDDLDYLWTHLGELTRAARSGDDLRLQNLVGRLVAESADPEAMSQACIDAIARLTRYEHPVLSRPLSGAIDQGRFFEVGDIVTAVDLPQWSGREGLVVFIDPQALTCPIGVQFRLDDGVAVWMFDADQLRRKDP
jgi:hypothetical protein